MRLLNSLILSVIFCLYIFVQYINDKDETIISTLSIKPPIVTNSKLSSEDVQTGTLIKTDNYQILSAHSNYKRISNDYKTEGMSKLYKWTDEKNTIVISNIPPLEKTDTEIFYYSKNNLNEENREKPVPDKVENLNINLMTGNSVEINDSNFMPNYIDNPLKIYTPSGLKDFIRYSKSIGKKIQIRGKELEKIIEEL